ncbi:hypothetical protein PRIPAC_93243 [Pristionchus pacificus]|uniref:Uncharacterized protein n=1 Tax=Pristionchus pacificus TaxID=54126 RepID=A0A2A6BQK8_PRIPA|nr:hypothetical protein PRIPAC_93243 [Pristionchus pacificus]|eukprot:PDM68200.1 hypothetical protein PRIPAC_46244 [Pristionchus pacificus]
MGNRTKGYDEIGRLDREDEGYEMSGSKQKEKLKGEGRSTSNNDEEETDDYYEEETDDFGTEEREKGGERE